METLMDRVWEAYWKPEPHGTQAALERVVALVLTEAIETAKTEARRFRDVYEADAASGAEEVACALIGLKASNNG